MKLDKDDLKQIDSAALEKLEQDGKLLSFSNVLLSNLKEAVDRLVRSSALCPESF